MNTYVVTCVNKDERLSRHESIKKIGGGIGTNAWRKTQAQAIQEIELRLSEFYVEKGGKKVKVIVSESAFGTKYIKTEADNTLLDNLLSLPECDQF